MFLIGVNSKEVDKSTEIKLTKNTPHDQSDKVLNIRVLVCGTKEAGKTALINRFKNSEYNDNVTSFGMNESRGYGSTFMRLSQNNKPVLLHLFEIQHFNNHQQIIKESSSATDTVAYVLCSVHKDKKVPEIRKDFEERCKRIRTNFPNCKIVIVGSKSDKTVNTDPIIFKQLAEDLNCDGVAIVSAKNNTNVDSLFKTTIESIAAAKENIFSLAAQTPAQLLAAVRYPGIPSAPPPPISKEESEIIDDNKANYDELILNIKNHMIELQNEMLSTFAANKERKLQKILALHEFICLTEYLPGIPASRHVQTIREKYGNKGLEEGNPSRTKIFLDAIVTGDKAKSRLELRQFS